MTKPSHILLGLIFGLAAGTTLSLINSELLSGLPSIIAPIGTLWINAIRMTIIPLLMSLLITSIADTRRKQKLIQLGARTIVLFTALIVAVSLYTLLLAPPLLSLLDIDATTASNLLQGTESGNLPAAELPPIRDWLVSLIPANLFQTMAGDSILPLLVFTVIFSLALTRINESGQTAVVLFFSAVRDAMFVIIGWIMAVAPLAIFALVFPLAANLGTTAITALGSYIIVACSLISFATIALYPLVAVAGRVKLQDFAKAVAPVQTIGFSTRSSMAALPATLTAAETLGVSSGVSRLVLPVAVSLFKFASPIARTSGTYFIALLYGIDLDPTDLLIVALAIGLLSFYSPGIPSGGLLVMTPVYTALGLPLQGIGILIAVDLVVDMFITAANVTANVAVATLLNRSEKE